MRELSRATRLLDDQFESESKNLKNHWKSRDGGGDANAAPPDGVKASFSRLVSDWMEVLRMPGKGSDLLSGLTVAAVALPLNVALAVACGLPPAAGLISGAIGGAMAALFGGSALQVTGPAAALGILVLGLVTRFGPVGAAAGAICVGLSQMVLFWFRAGRFMRFMPEAVLAGFTTGVGLKLLDQQIPLLFDVSLTVDQMLLTLHDPQWLNHVRWTSVLSGLIVVLFMMGLARFKKLPAAIFGLALVAYVSDFLGWEMLRVGAIPSALPLPKWPSLPATEWGALAIACIPLTILAAVESLLSARAVDRMTGGKEHAPNLEIFGQSLANFASGIFGGMTVSGVIVRSSVNVQAGGKTRLSAIVHAVLLLLTPLYFGGWIAKLPLAALAGLLCLVGYRLVEISTFVHLWKEKKHLGIAFLIAATGVLTGALTVGLVSALAIVLVPEWFKNRSKKASSLTRPKNVAEPLPVGIRAKISNPTADPFSQAARPIFRMPEENWEAHIADHALVHPTAFVHPNASLIGRVVLGPSVHVASEAALRADEGTPFFVGANTNVQDGVVMHALKGKWVNVDGRNWAIYIGERCSLAHQALVHGPCFIGDDTFIGFKAVVHDSVVGRGSSIGIGAIVVGVEIPEGRFVPHGSLIDTAEKAAALPEAQDAHRHFNEDVVDVNHGLSAAYRGEWLLPRMPEETPQPF